MAKFPRTSAGPRWFRTALANAPEHRTARVAGAEVRVRCWGREGLPGVVLVHGGAARSGWWDHIAPYLVGSHRVVALDLTGHGDSEWRTHYAMGLWAQEVIAAAEAGGAVVPPVVVGRKSPSRSFEVMNWSGQELRLDGDQIA